jgi:hypothetical protein
VMSAWGTVRATADINLLAHTDPSPLRNLPLRHRMKAFLESRGGMVDWRSTTLEKLLRRTQRR